MITLRKAKEQDLDLIRNLAEETWPSAYSEIISAEQIHFMLEKMYNKGELQKQLMEGHTFLIAENNNDACGFAGFSIYNHEESIFKLHKLYVLPSAQGLGVGKILIKEVRNVTKSEGGKQLILNVNKKNKAKDFYLNAGFIISKEVVLDIGNGFIMDDYIMELALD